LANRALLRRQIRQAWFASLAEDYASRRINSERSLQASLWAQLNSLLPRATRRMFIEPCFAIRGEVTQLRYPDLVICNSRSVIAVVELKYLPRTQPDWQKDIETFRWIIENKTALSVTNSRFRGVGADERVYPLADDLLYVWAGVHAPAELDLESLAGSKLNACFMALHAETSASGPLRLK
jgi:hypothetical protein